MMSKPKVLVIDDEEDLRENIKYVLQAKGYIVELAQDGVQGLKILGDFRPDLIILDLNMPNMGGIEFYQKICVGDVSQYPVFVLTARANMEKFFKDFNVDGFMSKPFEITDLVREIDQVINRKSIKSSAAQASVLRKIFIVDNSAEFSGKIGMALLNKSFTVNLAGTGTEAIERISKDVPDIVCVNMNLPDLSGEVVVQKLKRMAKTSGVKTILYTYNAGINPEITRKINAKEGIDHLVEVKSETDLIEAINDLLNK